MILINAQSSRAEKLGMFSKFVPLSIPTGIGCLAAYLMQRGHQAKIWDEAIKMLSPADIKELIKDCKKPYVFGISCLTASISRGYILAKQIKDVAPDAIIIFGGIHPTVLPEDVLSAEEVDFVIRKEGEIPLEALYRAIKNNESYENINGISFKKNGKIIHNPVLPGPDLVSLPSFPYHLFEEHIDKYDFGFIFSSRGCPYDCIFCSQRSITGRKFAARSPEQVVNDIELLVNKYGQTLITFCDDNILTNKSRIKNMCELIIERGLHKKTAFQCQVRGDDINDDILQSLKAANFITLFFGLETASERLMVVINKKETVEQNIKALELAKKYGFTLSASFILGLPTETKEERLQSYKLARKYLDYVRFNNATPYPGTKLYEIAISEKRLNVGKDWENLNACGTLVESPFSRKCLAYVPVGTSALELKKDILKYNLLFSFRWRVITDLLKRKKATAGGFRLSPRWFLTKELFYLMELGIRVIESWFGLLVLIFLCFAKDLIGGLFNIGKSRREEARGNKND